MTPTEKVTSIRYFPTDHYVNAALKHAEKGFYVFRLKPNGKTPYRKNWQKEATRDPEKIKALWAENPTCNIGIFCGKFDVV